MDLSCDPNWRCALDHLASGICCLLWSDKAQILKNYGLTFSIDLGDVSASRYLRWRGIEMTPETSMTTGAIVAR
jgi:hypothetical protein